MTGDVICPRDGWVHVACPDCATVATWPRDRLAEEGPPLCPHNGTGSVYPPAPGHARSRWTATVLVRVVPEGERG